MKNEASFTGVNNDTKVINNDTHLTKIKLYKLVDINEYIKPYRAFRGTLKNVAVM